MTHSFHPSVFDDPTLNVIHLLNTLSSENPEAISLASGRPDDEYCDPSLIHKGLARFTQYLADTDQSLATTLCQYGKTGGIINPILARYLYKDEDISVENADNIVVCLGFQEAATLTLLSVFDDGGVLLVPDPVFCGITGIAKLLGIRVVPVAMDIFLDPTALRLLARAIESAGDKIKALYVIPDFSNPTSDCLGLAERKELLALAEELDFFILEDNAYSYFRYEGSKVPALKALESRRVFYLGSFAKSIFPGLRMGYVVAPEGEGVKPFSTSSARPRAWSRSTRRRCAKQWWRGC